MTQKTIVEPTDPAFATADGPSIFERFQYSAAVKANGLVFVAGQVGLNPDGSVPADPATQYKNAFDRLALILKDAGSSLDDLVELVSYHTDLDGTLAEFMEVKSGYVNSPYPTWTILGVKALARPELVIELKAIAVAR